MKSKSPSGKELGNFLVRGAVAGALMGSVTGKNSKDIARSAVYGAISLTTSLWVAETLYKRQPLQALTGLGLGLFTMNVVKQSLVDTADNNNTELALDG